MTLVIVLPWN